MTRPSRSHTRQASVLPAEAGMVLAPRHGCICGQVEAWQASLAELEAHPERFAKGQAGERWLWCAGCQRSYTLPTYSKRMPQTCGQCHAVLRPLRWGEGFAAAWESQADYDAYRRAVGAAEDA